ncbi:hypothetical protein ACTXT7_011746, partial [Hymenolepis weldensis]
MHRYGGFHIQSGIHQDQRHIITKISKQAAHKRKRIQKIQSVFSPDTSTVMSLLPKMSIQTSFVKSTPYTTKIVSHLAPSVFQNRLNQKLHVKPFSI